MAKFRGNRVINGSHGRVWVNGELLMELESFEAKVTANREDVQIGLDMDSKITSYTGAGTMVMKKVYSRGKKAILDSWKKGEDARVSITSTIKDPDSEGKQRESISLENVWYNELTLQQWEQGILTEEIPFGFTVSDADITDEISK